MQDHLPANSLGTPRQVAECLCELFVEVDINGDGKLEWDEFTAFIMDNGMVERDLFRVDSIKAYYKVRGRRAGSRTAATAHLVTNPCSVQSEG